MSLIILYFLYAYIKERETNRRHSKCYQYEIESCKTVHQNSGQTSTANFIIYENNFRLLEQNKLRLQRNYILY